MAGKVSREELQIRLDAALKSEALWKEKAVKAEYSCLHDSMTGVLNRKGLYEEYAKDFYGYVYVADIDGLKIVNDTHGHAAGDVLILSVVKELRDMAFVGKGVVARVGGDEFVLLVNALLRPGVHENFSLGWAPITSFGLDSAIGQADSRMYIRKTARKNSH